MGIFRQEGAESGVRGMHGPVPMDETLSLSETHPLETIRHLHPPELIPDSGESGQEPNATISTISWVAGVALVTRTRKYRIDCGEEKTQRILPYPAEKVEQPTSPPTTCAVFFHRALSSEISMYFPGLPELVYYFIYNLDLYHCRRHTQNSIQQLRLLRTHAGYVCQQRAAECWYSRPIPHGPSSSRCLILLRE